TTSSSSASRSRAPTESSRPRGASSTSTDHGHHGLHGSALPYDGGGTVGQVAEAGGRPGKGGRHPGRGGNRQGSDGADRAGGRRRGDALRCDTSRIPHPASRGSRRRHVGEGVSPGETHRQGGGSRPQARPRVGTRWTRDQTGSGGSSRSRAGSGTRGRGDR